MKQPLSEQEVIRREKLEKLKELAICPYPQATFPIDCYAESAGVFYEKNKSLEDPARATLAGRIISIRNMGKASFAVLQDQSGRIQLYFRRESICPPDDPQLYDTVWKTLIDIGDIIGVKGFFFITKTGQLSLHVEELTLLSKAVKPLPVVKEAEGELYDAVTDPDFKYRQRYAHLTIAPSVKQQFLTRTKVVNAIRNFYNDLNMVEVETPILQPLPGGASARPFVTHHNTLDIPLYLRVANELYLKRLIIGGFEAVYEFAKDFRNEGMDRIHNPEFTILEMYIAYKDYLWMMENTEKLLAHVASIVHHTTKLTVGKNIINFAPPYKRSTFYDTLYEHTNYQLKGISEDALKRIAVKLKIDAEQYQHEAKLLDEIFSVYCEPKLIQPTFITDYPITTSPLTKNHRNDKTLVERFELYINGKEIANAYTELNDPIEQRKRFEEQAALLHAGDNEAMRIDLDFLRAMEYGMPPCAGIGIGIDRLVMLITNQSSIQDVLLFPQMRPEK